MIKQTLLNVALFMIAPGTLRGDHIAGVHIALLYSTTILLSPVKSEKKSKKVRFYVHLVVRMLLLTPAYSSSSLVAMLLPHV